jgi:DNA-binding CsgD family transcriptional regulator
VTLENDATIMAQSDARVTPNAPYCFVCGHPTTDSDDSFVIRGIPVAGEFHVHAQCGFRFSLDMLHTVQNFWAGRPVPHTGPITVLSPRELQVLEGIVNGQRDRDIAQRLGIAEHTVKNYSYDIRQKLGAKSRTDAAVRAVRSGLVAERRRVQLDE